ncbi:hypothetical protein CAPTEDRAFT_201518 [Capitella teleta]|uniref:Endonuclease/exonuclease/phosphatase domain-containing protein n=1 Tax=Capitella teleta TaxID=283909 RepID=R7UW50_CAPTE|nr:hypothetical protein CAPTEDRAFT_201518 [Capitella teleta]|eukprot:ELU07581.1 hypothetical protein CAPTEDRAFT_201518 [Capitella teleta]
MMYIKDHIDYTMLDIGEDTCEVQAARLLMEQGQATIFASVHRSPNSSKENSDNINAFIRNFSNKRAYTLIAGDFNYPTIGWKTMTGRTEADIEFIEALRDGFLIQHVDRPTRGRGSNNPSLLDLVLTKEHTATPTVEYHQPLGKSDHSILDIRIEMKQSETFIKTIPNYNRGNFDRMRRVLSDVDWEEGLGREETTQKKWELFHKTITNAVNRCVPKIKIKRKVLKNIPVDNKTLTKIRRKKRLWKQYLETGNQTIYHDYCRTRNQVRQLTRKNMRELE